MKPKLIPCFDSAPATAAMDFAIQAITALHRKLFPPRPEVNKFVYLLYGIHNMSTPGGFKITAGSTHSLLNKEHLFQRHLASPREVIFGQNIEHQMYCHLLCALGDSALIDGIESAYASGLVRAFSMLESKWEQLCDDLENGFPSSEISDAAMRESVVKLLDAYEVPERELMSAMESFQLEIRNDMGMEIVEYSSFLESDTSPKQLKLFIEIEKFMFPQQEKLQESVQAFTRCCSSLENGLGVFYKLQRGRGQIAPLLVSVVKPGAFDKILQVAIENGASAGQYKPPKIIRNSGNC
ncbi:hypothetical protein Tsubulata_039253 [Turnera subulata]|uniref:Uncharacterized protein n=1 Tax=Turnera subulata TaxID=218843 RepID=A0A9Q0J185_9ROSI|nr:hypothetical protein Tsubulata_039253 [Turnera subulata]